MPIEMDARIERSKERLAKLKRQFSQMLKQGKVTATGDITRKIRDEEKYIRELEDALMPKPLSAYIDKRDPKFFPLVDKIIECHLAADYLAECGYAVADELSALGLEAIEFNSHISRIAADAGRFAGELCGRGELLQSVVTDNSTLLEALHKKTNSYITSRTRIKNEGKTD